MAKRHGALRDAVVLVAVFALLLGGLYLYTGVWPPAVIVESGSMMHKECGQPPCDPGVKYGRFGFIDPGDLVLVKEVDGVDDVRTLVEGGRETYGMPGDVIIYYVANDRGGTPIIHRAVAYVELVGEGEDLEHWVRWSDSTPCEGGAQKRQRDGRSWCVYDERGVLIPSVPIQGFGSSERDPNPYGPVRASGFFTKGDNPSTNTQTDQQSGLSRDERGLSVPVQPEWIQGKARAELPWLGLIKLSLAGRPNEQNPPSSWVKVGAAYAPKDLWVMLGISLFLLVGVPLIYDGVKIVKVRREAAMAPGAPAAVSVQDTTHASVHLAWSDVPKAYSYRVYRDGERVGLSRTTTYDDTQVAPDRGYSYSVSAVSETGIEGPRSPEVRVTTPATNPAG